MRAVLIVLAGLIALYTAIWYARADYRQFDADREAWHRRCDRYIGQKTLDARGQACAEDLATLTAYAKRKGWTE